MAYIDIREHVKYLKFGYGRATDQLNIKIKAGLITREEALMLVKKIDGCVSEENIIRFCEFVEIERSYCDTLSIDRFVNKNYLRKKIMNGNLNLKDIDNEQEAFWAS